MASRSSCSSLSWRRRREGLNVRGRGACAGVGHLLIDLVGVLDLQHCKVAPLLLRRVAVAQRNTGQQVRKVVDRVYHEGICRSAELLCVT